MTACDVQRKLSTYFIEYLRETVTEIDWPVEYSIRKSARAKRVSLRITASGNVEVVVPKGILFFNIPKFVEKSRGWIITKLTELQQTRSFKTILEIPENLPLLAIDQIWEIHRRETSSELKLQSKHFLEISLVGDADNQALARQLIKKWLQKKAKKILPVWFDEVSRKANIAYNGLRINTAKSRWGSCSSHANINLNAKLLLLPPELVEHVMLHELSHTIHLDHSKSFWQLLMSLDPNTSVNSKILRKYTNPLIQWLDSV